MLPTLMIRICDDADSALALIKIALWAKMFEADYW